MKGLCHNRGNTGQFLRLTKHYRRMNIRLLNRTKSKYLRPSFILCEQVSFFRSNECRVVRRTQMTNVNKENREFSVPLLYIFRSTYEVCHPKQFLKVRILFQKILPDVLWMDLNRNHFL